MRIIYYLATWFLHYLLHPYLYFRIIKKKESQVRFREKLGITNAQRHDGYLIWFHCASIGELKSIIPIIDHYIKKNRILLTTTTLSSSEIFYKKYSYNKNIIHQFAPIDSPQIVKRFFFKWKPNIIFFTDSELWPNQIFYAKNNNIPMILLNGRMSKKSFSRWRLFKITMHEILKSFRLILCNSNQSADYFHYFKTNNIETIGNLKFIVPKNLNFKDEDNISLQKRIIFVALSTHDTEDEFCIKAHISLKIKYPNLLTLIIPRHINRIAKIEEIVKKLKLNSLTQDSLSDIKDNTDILIINTYGNTQRFLKLSKYIFIGGSLINHGGQNPIEVAYNNSLIFHGPYVHNFTEIYNFLNKENISYEVKTVKELIDHLERNINVHQSNNIKEKIINMGNEILSMTIKKLDQYIIN
jgi:3-deoxy-D-manno-octulosonic-acid transferase